MYHYGTNVETWNGAGWTEVADISTARSGVNLAGTSTSLITTGGFNPSYPSGNAPYAEEWNGASWAEVAEMNTARYAGGGSGVSATDALIFGGSNTGGGALTSSNNEIWNGSSWTSLADLNTGRYGVGGFGTTASAICCGGANPVITNTEQWNGSTWTEVNDLSTANRTQAVSSQPAGTSQGFAAGGSNATATLAVTEEWTQPQAVTNTTITD